MLKISKPKKKIISEDYDYNKELWKQFQVIYFDTYLLLIIFHLLCKV